MAKARRKTRKTTKRRTRKAWQVKGSTAAKRHMAHLRAMRRKGSRKRKHR